MTQVVHSLLLGGSERLACSLAQRFDTHQIRPSICAIDVDGPLRLELEQASVPVAVMNRRAGTDWRLFPALFRLFRHWRADVVQTHHLGPLIYSAVAARLAGAALVHVEHEYFTLSNDRDIRRLRLLARLSSRVVAVGDEIREFLVTRAGLPASKVTVIRNGVDTMRFRPEATVSRPAIGLPAEGPFIGHVARLEPDKDQETLLKAFAHTRQTCASAKLVIVGGGSLDTRLRQLAESLHIDAFVHFLGPRHDVADLLPHFDVFVLSSIREGLPLALLEAMSCARPVVATSVGDIPTVLGHGACGVLVRPADSGGLASVMSRLLSSQEARTTLGRDARERVCSHYSLARATTAYQGLYRDILPDHEWL